MISSIIRHKFFLAAVLGGLGSMAFPPFFLWPVLFVVFAPLLRMVAGEKSAGKAFRQGFLFGFFFFFCTLHWLIPTMQTFGPLPFPAAFGALALFSSYLALYPAVFFALAQNLSQKETPPVLLLPAIWVGLELLRSFLCTGFPWAQAGHGLAAAPLLIQTADLGGVYLLSFGIMLVNTALAFYPRKKSGILLACGFWLLALGYGFYRMDEMKKKTGEAEMLSVSILQGAIPPHEKWEPAFQRRALDSYKKLVSESPKGDGRLFLWPETALPFFLFQARFATEAVLDVIRESETPHLVGSLAYTEDGSSLFNTSYLIGPEGRVIGEYRKNHLVPFGEYIPLRKQLPFLAGIAGMQTEFVKGDTLPALHMGDLVIGPLICFESVFPQYSRKAVTQGANILSVQTNDAWFGEKGGPAQHLAFSQFRAVEFRRSVIRSANTGVSAIISPTGNILERTPMNASCALHGNAALFNGKTLYARAGNSFAWLCILADSLYLLYFFQFRLRVDGLSKRFNQRG